LQGGGGRRPQPRWCGGPPRASRTASGRAPAFVHLRVGAAELEELRELKRSGASFELSAALTSAALAAFALCAATLLNVVLAGTSASLASLLNLVGFATGALVVCALGVRDHLRGIELPGLNRWLDWLRSTRPSSTRPLWVDCYASRDPVPNGVVAPQARDLTREICNGFSMLHDHTTYWSNRDQFISLLYGEIAGSRDADPFPDLPLPGESLPPIGGRRRSR